MPETEPTEPTFPKKDPDNLLEELRRLCDEYNLTHLVVYARTLDEQQYLTTQGVDERSNREAAQIGNDLKDLLGWDKSTHRLPEKPARRNRRIN